MMQWLMEQETFVQIGVVALALGAAFALLAIIGEAWAYWTKRR